MICTRADHVLLETWRLAPDTSSSGPNLAFHHDLLTVAGDVPFFFFQVSTSFYPKGNFSELNLEFVPFTTRDDHKIVIYAKEHLIAWRLNQSMNRFSKNCKSKPWPPYGLNSKSLEKEVVVALCQHIFVPLSRPDTVFLEHGYTSLLSALGPGIKIAKLGMGSSNTWHGTPDVRVRGAEIISNEDEEEDDDDDCSSTATDGATTTIEARRVLKKKNLSQAVGTCVVSSFIERNLHPDKQTAVPTIVIGQHRFQVCLYDCEHDILLVSSPILLAHPKERLSRHALLLLWLVINHRLFLQPLSNIDSLTSTIKSRLKENERLSYFNGLIEKNVDWSTRTRTTTLDDLFSGSVVGLKQTKRARHQT